MAVINFMIQATISIIIGQTLPYITWLTKHDIFKAHFANENFLYPTSKWTSLGLLYILGQSLGRIFIRARPF
jgi:hypothetical protein